MIIGNNNNNNNYSTNSNFMNNNPNNNKHNTIPEKKAVEINANIMNKNDMADKSFAMLQERYEQGLISIDEFTKQCNKLNKLRQK